MGRLPMHVSIRLKPQDTSTDTSTPKDAACVFAISPKLRNAYNLWVTPHPTLRAGRLPCTVSPQHPANPRMARLPSSHSSPPLLTYLAHNSSPIKHTHGCHTCSNAHTPTVSFLCLRERRPCLPGTKANQNASCNPLSTMHRPPPHHTGHTIETFIRHPQATQNSSSILHIMQSLLPAMPNCKLWCKTKRTG